MSSFKPGDWVVNTTTDDYYDGIRNWFQLKETDLIFKQGVNATEWESNFKFVNSHELWQPKVGEWVWSKGSYTQAFIFKWTSAHEQVGIINYTNYEPFIGQLPAFIKDRS